MEICALKIVHLKIVRKSVYAIKTKSLCSQIKKIITTLPLIGNCPKPTPFITLSRVSNFIWGNGSCDARLVGRISWVFL